MLRQLSAFAVLLFASCVGEIASRVSDFGYKRKEVGQPTGPIAGTWKPGDMPQPLNTSKLTHVLLEVDGGGIMGITPALVLEALEKELQKRRPGFADKHLRDLFSVCSGTSTGAIITGMVAAGVPAETIGNFYTGKGVELFNSTGRNPVPVFPILRPQFKRAVFQEAMYETLRSVGKRDTLTLDDLYTGPLLLIAAFDLISNRTLWFRTRDLNDQRLQYNGSVQLVDAISASALSAAVYFGELPAPNVIWDRWQADGSTELVRGAVFNDGGQGTQNNTLGQTTIQAIMRDWGSRVSKNDQVVIISLGCGNYYPIASYESMSKLSGLGQMLAFLKNQARPESGLLQWRAASFISAHNPNFKIFRFDYVPAVGSSAFSAKLAKDYIAAAIGSPDGSKRGIVQRRDFLKLLDDLCKVRLANPGVRRQEALPQINPTLPFRSPFPRGSKQDALQAL
jgi:hypothetical protein